MPHCLGRYHRSHEFQFVIVLTRLIAKAVAAKPCSKHKQCILPYLSPPTSQLPPTTHRANTSGTIPTLTSYRRDRLSPVRYPPRATTAASLSPLLPLEISIFIEQHLILLWLILTITACCGVHIPTPKRRRGRRFRQAEAAFHRLRISETLCTSTALIQAFVSTRLSFVCR